MLGGGRVGPYSGGPLFTSVQTHAARGWSFWGDRKDQRVLRHLRSPATTELGGQFDGRGVPVVRRCRQWHNRRHRPTTSKLCSIIAGERATYSNRAKEQTIKRGRRDENPGVCWTG